MHNNTRALDNEATAHNPSWIGFDQPLRPFKVLIFQICLLISAQNYIFKQPTPLK